MGSLVKKMGEIVARETRYVEEMPLATFLDEDPTALLKEADSLVLCQVSHSLSLTHSRALAITFDL